MMLPSTSCKYNEKKPIISNLLLSPQNETINSIVCKDQAKYLKSLNFGTLLLIACLMILGNCLLCIRAQAESPFCYCNGKLYRFCPDLCGKKQTELDDLLGQNLIDSHPDHSYDFGTNRVKPPVAVNKPSPILSESDKGSVQDSVKEENGQIVVHRKVYVTGKSVEYPIIHPVKITVPVTYKEESVVLDAPEPVFKLRTYTEYETKPETIQVPVVTTIIKPKNVKKDQVLFS